MGSDESVSLRKNLSLRECKKCVTKGVFTVFNVVTPSISDVESFISHAPVYKPPREPQPPLPKPRLPQNESISMIDFTCHAMLGRGHFGKVSTSLF